MDAVDRKILGILQEKARIPNVEVARQVDMAPSAVLERIRKLEKSGIIDGYEVRLNPQRFKRNLAAFVFVNSDLQFDRDFSVGKTMSEIPEVQEVHFVSGEDCYLLKIRVEDTRELLKIVAERITGIEGVRSVRTNIVFKTQKETSRIPLDKIGEHF